MMRARSHTWEFHARWALLVLLSAADESRAACPQTPEWAKGRDPTTCQLIVDGGADYGYVKFDMETDKYSGPGNRYQRASPTAKDVANGCPTSNLVAWGSTFDNYAIGGQTGEDVAHINTNSNVKYLLLRDSLFKNAWVCHGGAWTGPNGHSCALGANDPSHSDVLQFLSIPKDAGWIVLQNTDLRFGDQQIGIWSGPNYRRGAYSQAYSAGMCPDPAGTGGMLWQNVKFGNGDPSFEADCLARGNQLACKGGNQFVVKNDGDPTARFGDIWLVGVHTYGAKFRIMGGVPKIVVIGGSGGRNGWPGPLGPGESAGSGTCPNGKVSGQYHESGPILTEVFCYSSIEKALAAGHRPPPFLNLSSIGWETAPGGSADPSTATSLVAPELRFGG